MSKHPLELPFRQIHMDFHTSELIGNVAAEFDGEQFAATLDRARVNSCTCFARCHHGYLYYDSKLNPERIHPHLQDKNLLPMQLDALHRRGIRAPIYITVQWDHFTANEHPEWLTVSTDGGPVVMTESKPLQAGFYRFLCLNSPYRQWLKNHTAEVLKLFPTDGIFFDIVWTADCVCRFCREKMQALNIDLADAAARLRYAHSLIVEFCQDMTAFVRTINPDCAIYYNNGDVAPDAHEGIAAFTHLEFDALPSDSGGSYINFPRRARFDRNLGLDCAGMTGKFHRGWGDIHSFKAQAALEFDCFLLMALNCKCIIGDQLDPSGKIDPYTYELIGSVYSQVELKEPWCRGATAVCEIGVIASSSRESAVGVTRILQEGGHQFNVLDRSTDLTQYKLIVLPDRITLEDPLRARLEQYIRGGGRVIASFEAGMDSEAERFVLPLGVEVIDAGPRDAQGQRVRGQILGWKQCDYADYVLPRGEIGKGLPPTEHVMYSKCVDVQPLDGATTLMDAIAPVFYRTREHFQSHMQAASSRKVSGPAVVRQGEVIYFSHAIFNLYHDFAMPWCKRLALNAIDLLLPQPLVRHNGPSTTIVTLNDQQAEQRRVLHVMHYVPERRATWVETVEETIPLHDLQVSVRIDSPVRTVRLVPQGDELPFQEADGRLRFSLPRVDGHQMVEMKG